MRKLPPLNAVRVFEAAARHGSFTAAANELCVTVTAVSHQIHQLEAVLGRKLFERSGRAVVLTDLGMSIFPQLRQSLDQMADAFAAVRAQSEGDVLTVSTTRAFAGRWLMPRLQQFSASFPAVTVNIEATEDALDLASNGVDLAIRYGPADDRSRESILFEDRYIAVAAIELTGTDRRASINDLHARPLLAYKWKNRQLEAPSWSRWLTFDDRSSTQDFRISWFSDEILALHAAERGMGALLCSDALVADQLREGSMSRIEGPSLPGFAYRVVQTPSKLKRKPISLFLDWLHSEATTFSQQAVQH